MKREEQSVFCVGDSTTNDAGLDADVTGTEGHACFPNSTCNAGLTCISSVCVNLDSGTDAAKDAPSDANADAGPTGVVFENAASGSSGSPVTIVGFDPGTNVNRLLVVALSVSPNGMTSSVSVTFGSSVLQELTAALGGASPNNNPSGYYACTSRIFYLVNPTGKGNVVATFTGLANPENAAVGVAAFSNVSQTKALQNGAHTTGSTTSMQIPVATAPGHMTLANVCNYASFSTTTGTQRWLVTTIANGAGSTIASTGATNTHSWTQTNAYAWVASGVDILPAP